MNDLEGQEETQPCSRESQKQVFRCQLAKQAQPSRPQGQTDGDFPLPMSGTGQKKVGNIGAGNEQHKTNGAKQQEQQRSHLTHHLGVEWQSYSPQLDSVAELR